MHALKQLPPFPKGWFSVGFSSEFPRGSVVTRKLGGRELVLFRTESGALAALDPVCPHLGAHLGHGGTVEGETIRCPFHGFRFGADGACVATGYGTKPPKVSARSWEVDENGGAVLAWLDPHGGPSSFRVPRVDVSDFTELRHRLYTLRGHPQDTTENSVDLGHFSIVHGYDRARMIGELVVDGPSLHARYEFFRRAGLFGKTFGGVMAEFETHVHGLGYSLVETKIPSLGLEFKNFVFATPATDMGLELRIAACMKKLGGPERLRLPVRALEKLVLLRAFDLYRSDVEQDFRIWKHKEFVPRPALAQGDGPVMRYRRWAEQFYAPPEPVLKRASGEV